MPLRDLESWMWAEACDMLDRADRLHRQLFRPSAVSNKRPTWEPPVDIYETSDEFMIMMALPGIAPERIQVVFDGSRLIVSGQRHLPIGGESEIRRLEIPYGRFERVIELSSGQVELAKQDYVMGCLYLVLRKK